MLLSSLTEHIMHDKALAFFFMQLPPLFQTSKMVQEKDDQIDTLQERVKLLEQRISDSGLSGDDRLTALGVERDSMEQKLSEARQQLTEVKSTWSDKISHLEDQVGLYIYFTFPAKLHTV